MNTDNLRELINRYEAKIDKLYNEENDEIFKWKAEYTGTVLLLLSLCNFLDV